MQYDLASNYLPVAGGYFRSLTMTEYKDCTFGAHMVPADCSYSCLFALYTEHDKIITKHCSMKFVEKHLPYVRSLNDMQWYITTKQRLELAVTCPRKKFRPFVRPGFSIITLKEFCIAFSAQVKLYAPVKNIGTIDWKLEVFNNSFIDYKIIYFLIISIHAPWKLSKRGFETMPNKLDGISVPLDTELLGKLS